MLSRIARALTTIGVHVERAQNVIRVLEVNHKMHLERETLQGADVWPAIAQSFDAEASGASEASLYEELVLSGTHRFSVRRCLAAAREQGRTTRDHISEEMWLHLNRYHLELARIDFAAILSRGRSEFNREIETFCDAFQGLADNTLVRGPAWHFLRVGKFLERTAMAARILDIKRKTLALAPADDGRPLDVHPWQTLLRSISGYEPYRRVHTARIVPTRVLEFVLKSPDFPRSMRFALAELSRSLHAVGSDHPAQRELRDTLDDLQLELRQLDPGRLLLEDALEDYAQLMLRRCTSLGDALEEAYFSALRRAPRPLSAAPGAGLVPQ